MFCRICPETLLSRHTSPSNPGSVICHDGAKRGAGCTQRHAVHGATAPALSPWIFPFHFGLLDLRHSVGLLGRVVSSSQDLYTNTQTLNIHVLSGIRTHDPGFRASEDSAWLRPIGYRDRPTHDAYHDMLVTLGTWNSRAARECALRPPDANVSRRLEQRFREAGSLKPTEYVNTDLLRTVRTPANEDAIIAAV
jgi:hypothetical protein